MSFILVDYDAPDRDLQIGNRYWHPIVTEIRRAKLLPDEKAEKIAYNLCERLDKEEVLRIARHLRKEGPATSLAQALGSDVFNLIVDFIEESNGLEIC